MAFKCLCVILSSLDFSLTLFPFLFFLSFFFLVDLKYQNFLLYGGSHFHLHQQEN